MKLQLPSLWVNSRRDGPEKWMPMRIIEVADWRASVAKSDMNTGGAETGFRRAVSNDETVANNG